MERLSFINKKAVTIFAVLFVLGVITTMTPVAIIKVHHIYKITVHPDKEYTHEWFYYLLTFWRLALAIGTLYVLFKKCSFTAARKRWYLPAICIGASSALLGWYLINGGAPRIAGHKLFQLQEALCIPYIMAFESIIEIGMVPANSGYRRLFHKLSINAAIFDKQGHKAVSSVDWKENAEDEDHRLCTEPIHGGCIKWVEDISDINNLNHSIEAVKENLKDENDLIRQENDVRAERISFETRNRLYNSIAQATHTRAVRVNELLTAVGKETGDQERMDIVYAMILSAYIKRIGNLILIADEKSTVQAKELAFAISESIEYLKLRGCVCALEAWGEIELPSQMVLLAYELFEEAIEAVWLRINTLTVEMNCDDHFELIIAMDEPAEAISSTWKYKQMRAAGAALSTRYEDETYYISMSGAVACEDKVSGKEVFV